MGEKKVVKVMVTGGQASAGPPLGPALGPLGVNLYAVVQEINKQTKDFEGLKVPVEVEVDVETKEFVVRVGVPPTSALILKEIGAAKGSSRTPDEVVGNLSMEQVVKIAKLKFKDSLANTLKACVKEVLGTCVSMGVTVEGKDPRVVQEEVDKGVHDELISKYEKELEEELSKSIEEVL